MHEQFRFKIGDIVKHRAAKRTVEELASTKHAFVHFGVVTCMITMDYGTGPIRRYNVSFSGAPDTECHEAELEAESEG